MNKKHIIILPVVILIFSVTACGQSDSKIDEYTWNLATVQSTESNGAIIAYDPNIALADDSYANVTAIKISLSAEKGKFIMRDETDNKIYKGSYSITDRNSKSTFYNITIDGKEGTAIASDTKYANGTLIATLILQIDNHVLNFQENK